MKRGQRRAFRRDIRYRKTHRRRIMDVPIHTVSKADLIEARKRLEEVRNATSRLDWAVARILRENAAEPLDLELEFPHADRAQNDISEIAGSGVLVMEALRLEI